MKFHVDWVARELKTLPSSVRRACNRAGVKIDKDDSFTFANERQQQKWVCVLAALPSNPAERLRYDMGIKARAEPETDCLEEVG